MRICTSATLAKILLGIAGAGALIVAPVRAETTPVGGSSEALSEPQSASDASSPSGAEQLLPLDPPSAPVEPAGAATQLEPVTPASSLESPAQAAPESIGGAESFEATEPTDASTPEGDVLSEDSDATSSEIEEEVPVDDVEAVEGTEEGTEATVEEEDASPIGGTEDVPPADDDLSGPIEGSVDSEDAAPADPSLIDEDSSIDAPEEALPSESDISPSSSVPSSAEAPQLVAEGGEPSAPPEASSEDVSPAGEAAPVDESVPSDSAAPNAAPVSDQELQQFANTVPELRTIEQGTQQEISGVIQGSGFDEARFNEIYQSQQSPDAPAAAEVTEEEKQSFTQALSDIQVIEEKSKVEQEKVIQSQGLEPERFMEILISLRQDPSLQTKVQQMIPN
ncbi:hypothetical protein C1752_03421 [Acaryochloris thomasi RCC1774]|uniref:DUF4168 domain-containing protein n=1 Tax=Acaryochloris thomasi RCC1774 TaxID=1764569 RepID=A0A2W1JMA0_9CYAN|nr:DUF4168 domain-containing protein [Acaryochloris thomasi]PZD72585.1 hypothetical protein C1752_03421 [Acaryochloris thomasi RCC1774]